MASTPLWAIRVHRAFLVPRRVWVRLSSTVSSPSRPAIVFSGIQPTGIPHLGNYLGAIQNWVKLQNTSTPQDTLIYSIVGWHALTLPQDPAELYEAKFETLASLLALGIDPKRSIVFSQDDVSEHLSLSWILTCLTPMGKLKRMTTWKSKLATIRNTSSDSGVEDSMLNLGLFSYPVLQAADILAYHATHVPVGEDQMQHLELCRDLAELFNRRYPDIPHSVTSKPFFNLPRAIYTHSPRILSLRDPSQKMSKSAPDADSRIMLTDSPTSIAKKIRSAVTDSIRGITYDPAARPGVSNLLAILAAFQAHSPHALDTKNSFSGTRDEMETLAARYSNKGASHLKNDVAEAVIEGWRNPRENFTRLKADRNYLMHVLADGSRRARDISSTTLARVKEKIGLANVR
ncbi:tryptophanyl-tRNA synthetase [Gautieria morchelliformis]|nr:tryptophanyl-tRNA synthetase [Gautieria morchelliformis]